MSPSEPTDSDSTPSSAELYPPVEGSWWSDWKKWVGRYNGGQKVAARNPGDGDVEVLEDAPGSYVKFRLT